MGYGWVILGIEVCVCGMGGSYWGLRCVCGGDGWVILGIEVCVWGWVGHTWD